MSVVEVPYGVAYTFGAVQGLSEKRLLTRARLNPSAFSTSQEDICESQTQAPIPTMNPQMGGASSQDSRSPKNKAHRYTVMWRLSLGVEPEDSCLGASTCKQGLQDSLRSTETLREREAEAWGAS